MCVWVNKITNQVLFHFTAIIKKNTWLFSRRKAKFLGMIWLLNSYVPWHKNDRNNNNIMTMIITVILRGDQVLWRLCTFAHDSLYMWLENAFLLSVIHLKNNHSPIKTTLELHPSEDLPDSPLASASSPQSFLHRPDMGSATQSRPHWMSVSLQVQGLLKLTLLGSTSIVSDSVGLGWGPKICISNKLPAAAAAAGIGTTRRMANLYPKTPEGGDCFS